MPYFYNNKQIREGRSWKNADGITHPSTWARWSDAEKKAAGLVWRDPPAPAPQPEPTLEEIRERWTTQVIEERTRRLDAGTTIDGIPVSGSIQVQADLTALDRLAEKATTNGVSEAVFEFRDQNDVVHKLTPEQVNSLFDKGSQWVMAIRKASWDLIDADPIPDDVTDDNHWNKYV